MTDIPFARTAPPTNSGPGWPIATATAVTGSFVSPSGGTGTFTGWYRLERFASEFGQLAAVGLFTGELTDDHGGRIGTSVRRQTAAVEVMASETALLVRVGPLDVNLLGFLVTVTELSVAVQGGRRALRLLEPPDHTGRMPPSAAESPRLLPR